MTNPQLKPPTDNTEVSEVLTQKPTNKIDRRKPQSIGTRLFISVMGGALIGLGGMAVFFYQTILHEAKTQIQSSLNGQVGLIEGKLTSVQEYSSGLKAAVEFLHARGTKTEEIYKQLAFRFYQQRPSISFGGGFGQTPYGLLPDRQWFFPYYYQDQKVAGQLGKRLPDPNRDTFYSELFQDDRYYEREYYTTPVKAQKPLWTEPYSSYGVLINSFTTPLLDAKGKLIGIGNFDVNVLQLAKEIDLDRKVYQGAGYFALISAEGRIISYPPAQPDLPSEGEKGTSYQTVSQLKGVWSKISQEQAGLVQVGGNFWAYKRLPSTNWLMLAVVPTGVVTAPVLFATAASTLGAGAVLAIAVLLFMRYLNRRLQPMLKECNKLANIDPETEAQIKQGDELEQLTFSFYNLLEQLELKEQQIREEVVLAIQTQEQLKQTSKEQQENEVMQYDIGHILDIVCAVEEGDLTVKAEVSDRATGLVADTLNRLIEELARIMSVVLSTAEQVTQGAEQLEKLAVSTTKQVEQQANSVMEVQSLMENVNKLSQDTAQQALWSDEAVKDAQSAIVQGQKEMSSMAENITVLQQGTEQIVRRTQNLTDFVTLAAQFTQDQKRVAALTRVLALNASTIATRASEQQDPEQFASVAREFATIATQVNDLAVQTNQSLVTLKQKTDQIQTVVSGVKGDIQEISGSVERFTTNVDSSRQVFDNIKTVTEKVSQIGQEVTKSSVAIATVAETTLEAIHSIATAAAENERSSRYTLEQTGSMDRLARTLYSRVSFFRISEQIIDELPPSSIISVSNPIAPYFSQKEEE
ncbi:MAG: hypothetical protein ACRC2R_03060 [Xenococcaceae cyanobacterium]